tara:strand:+ start:317 stop:568 length:252 start_codon:yes stop_codon:yes gene_type:complete
MLNSFKDKLKVKVDRDTGICHLSVSTTEYKVEVFKVSVGDMDKLVTSFAHQRNTKDVLSGSNDQPAAGAPEPIQPEESEENNQ